MHYDLSDCINLITTVFRFLFSYLQGSGHFPVCEDQLSDAIVFDCDQTGKQNENQTKTKSQNKTKQQKPK